MQRSWRTILVSTALAGSMAVAGSIAVHHHAHDASKNPSPNSRGQKRQDRAKNGTYATTVAGNFHGVGSANVQDASVGIQAKLVDDYGQSHTLTTDELPVDGPYFSGSGSMDGTPFTIFGRVDAARASRVIATFVFADGRGGRIVGRLPSSQDPPDEAWDNDQDALALIPSARTQHPIPHPHPGR